MNPRKLIAFSVFALLIVQQSLSGDTIKTLDYRNAGEDKVIELDYTFNLFTDKAQPFNPRPVDLAAFNAGQASNLFTSVTGIGSDHLHFTQGTVNPKKQDMFVAPFKGDLKPEASVLIKSVAESTLAKAFATIYTYDINNPAVSGPFNKRFSGFTNNEYFLLNPGQNGELHLLNDSSDLTYHINNLKVYANLSESNFNLDNWLLTGSASPAFQSSDYTIDPGEDGMINLGTISGQSYALAVASGVQLMDSEGNIVASFDGPMGFAQTAVPEPSTLALIGFGSCTLAVYGWRRAKIV